jgi:hypothetical protein
LSLFGPSFPSVKLGCGLAAILSIVCIFSSAAKISTRQIALLVTAYATLALLSITNSFAFPAASFWLRPDPLLIFFVSIGLLGVLSGNRSIATVVSAIAFGCSLNLKINAFINFLPIYVLLFLRFGLISTLLASIGALLTALIPFIIFPQISLENHLIWLGYARNKANSFAQLIQVSKWLLYITLPIVLSLGYLFCRSQPSFKQFIGKNQGFVYTLLGCVISSFAFSIKIGVLENNHLPFVPLFAYLLALTIEWLRVESPLFSSDQSANRVTTLFISAAVALIITMPVAIAPEVARLGSTLVKSPSNQVLKDITGIINAHADTTIGMGFSQGAGNYELTYYRPVLVFAGNPYLVDAVVMFEMQASGVDTSSHATIEALRNCQTQLWLFPKPTQQPFDLKNFYPPHDIVFNEEFRRTFLQHYQPFSESKFYELWACKKRLAN